jgi:hypothetical protein
MNHIDIIKLESLILPSLKENKQKKWVEWGAKNDYFEYLIERMHGSPTNGAIISAIADMIFGKGLKADDEATLDQLKEVLSKDDLRRVCFDLKALGQGAFQVIYGKGKATIAKMYHMPTQQLRAEILNDDGDIEAYYYSNDWEKVTKTNRTIDVQRIPAFGFGERGDNIEILYIRPYKSGSYYYTPPDYTGGLVWADTEERVGVYHMNNVASGFSATKLINFNNGDPGEEERRQIKAKINKILGGQSGEKIVIAFNESKETAATIDDIPVTDADKQYEFVSRECMTKLFTAHRVTSPRLLGINEGGGLGNNADEITVALDVFMKTVIRPFQELVLDAIDRVMVYNGWTAQLDFVGLMEEQESQDNDAETTEVEVEEVAENLSAVCLSHTHDFDDHAAFAALEPFGEVINPAEWMLIGESAVNYDDDEDALLALVDTGDPNPDAKSTQDTALFKVRYAYAPATASTKSRDFCRAMVGAGKVYRKEDILAMSLQSVNPGFGIEGADNYNIWFYKGGPNCHHYWMRQIYMRKRDNQGRFMPNKGLDNDKQVGVNEARRAGFDPPTNPKKVAQLPVDMPNNGYYKPRN